MAFLTISNVTVSGLAACVPKNEVANNNYPGLSEREKNLLIKTTGIAFRRIAPPDICASDLCFVAATNLIEALNWSKKDIELLIFVSQTPDYQTPATAVILQERLGLPTSCLAFDINLGCSAYVYGLSAIAGLLSNMKGKKGLLLVGDVLSKIISETDKTTAPLFSDAGSATALSWDENSIPFFFNLQSDGTGFEAIIVKESGARNQSVLDHADPEKKPQMLLNGTEVFNFGLREVAPNVSALFNFTNHKVSEIDYFVFHQANKLMNESIKRKLQLPDEKVPSSLFKYGNTSSATIPVTMVTEMQSQLSGRSLHVLLSGFGVGLSWGSAIIRTSPMVCLPLIEL